MPADAQRLAFTKTALAKLAPPASGRRMVYDLRTPGLALRLAASGAAAFYVYRKVAGRPMHVRLGTFPTMTPEQARKAAAAVNATIAGGRDPNAHKRSVRDETTFGELFAAYLDGHAKPHKKSWAEDERQFARYLTGWKGRRLSAIKRADVAAWHARLREASGPYQANRTLALVSAVFSFAERSGWQTPNPARGVRRFKEQSRDRFMGGDELRRFFAALADEPNVTLRDYFMASLLTGARRANVLAMRWADLDLGRGLWRVAGAEAKGGAPLLIILPPPAVDLLTRRRAEQADGCPWVFPTGGASVRVSASGHIEEPKGAWARVLKRAGIADLRIHDLRRTLGSWAAAGGASLPIIGKALGHKSVATTAIYARLDVSPVRVAVNAATAAMLAAVGATATPAALPAPADAAEGKGASHAA